MKPPHRFLLAAILLETAPMLACVDTSAPPTCEATASLTVSSGTTPDFSWEPQCLISTLIVSDTDGVPTAWTIQEYPFAENLIAPPVHYATIPDGAVQDGPPVTLQAGHTYRATIVWIVGSGRGLATKVFVP